VARFRSWADDYWSRCSITSWWT